MENVKIETLGFPEVGQIRKGMPKKRVVKHGSSGSYDTWVVGADLNEFFRVSFVKGAEDAKEKYMSLHQNDYKVFGSDYEDTDGFLVKRIKAIMPFRNIASAWSWSNEAYDAAGRRMAQADDNHYISLRDGNTGKYVIKNELPYTVFNHGDAVTYTKNNKEYSLPIKPTCRLSLFLPELGQLGKLVYLTFRSTSYYDRIKIDAQIKSIQMLADIFANGNVGGVPFWIYRREQQLVWNKPDGGAMKVKKWLVNLEADADWVKMMTERMSKFALGGGTDYSLPILPSPIAEQVNIQDEPMVVGSYDPDEEDDEIDGEIDVVETEQVFTAKDLMDDISASFKSSTPEQKAQIKRDIFGGTNPTKDLGVEKLKEIKLHIDMFLDKKG